MRLLETAAAPRVGHLINSQLCEARGGAIFGTFLSLVQIDHLLTHSRAFSFARTLASS